MSKPESNAGVKPGQLATSDWLGSLSSEAREAVEGMVRYCLDHEFCMGPDGGWVERADKYGDPVRMRKRKFRAEIETALNYPNRQMAEYADAMFYFPGSRGTLSMVREAQARGLPIFAAEDEGFDQL